MRRGRAGLCPDVPAPGRAALRAALTFLPLVRGAGFADERRESTHVADGGYGRAQRVPTGILVGPGCARP